MLGQHGADSRRAWGRGQRTGAEVRGRGSGSRVDGESNRSQRLAIPRRSYLDGFHQPADVLPAASAAHSRGDALLATLTICLEEYYELLPFWRWDINKDLSPIKSAPRWEWYSFKILSAFRPCKVNLELFLALQKTMEGNAFLTKCKSLTNVIRISNIEATTSLA